MSNPDFPTLAEQQEKAISKAFDESVQEIRQSVNLRTVIGLLASNHIDAAFQLLGVDPIDFILLERSLIQTFTVGGDAAMATIPVKRTSGGSVFRVQFNGRASGAQAWAANKSSTLIVEITEEQRSIIRERLEDGIRRGDNPRTIALDLVGRLNKATGRREGGIIGLTSQQNQWALNYERELTEGRWTEALMRKRRNGVYDKTLNRLIRDGGTIAAEKRAQMVLSYRQRLLAYRGETIARNEAMRALGAGQAEAYDQAIERGAVAVETLLKTWHTAVDERVRSTHRRIPGMNRGGRKWSEPFMTPTGPSQHAPHAIDVQCRCYERVTVDFFAGIQ